MRGWAVAAQVAIQVCLWSLWVPAIAAEPQDLIEVGGEQPTVVEIDGREFLRYRLRGESDQDQRGIEATALKVWIRQQLANAMDRGPRAKGPDSIKVDYQVLSQSRKALFHEDRREGTVVVAPIDSKTLVYRAWDADGEQAGRGYSLPALIAEVDLLVPVRGGAALIFAMGTGTEPRVTAGENGRYDLVRPEFYGYTAVRMELPNQLWLFGQFTVNNILSNDWAGNEAVLGVLFQF